MEAALGRVVEIDDGYDFRVVVVGGSWVLRFPRRPGVIRTLETEAALLPALAPVLPVLVPSFEYVSSEPPFVVYRLIDGAPLTDEDPDGVRAFLDALHGFDATGLPVPRPDWLATYLELAEEFRRLVVPLLDTDERAAAEALFAELETLAGFEPRLTHSDLGREHLLCRDGRLVGVIDWGDARIGDPALDYAWLLNGPFDRWDVDDELRRRARIYHRLSPWFEAHYGVVTGQPGRATAALPAIRERLSG